MPAVALARQMICMYGMSDEVGLVHCARRNGMFLASQDGSLHTDLRGYEPVEIVSPILRGRAGIEGLERYGAGTASVRRCAKSPR